MLSPNLLKAAMARAGYNQRALSDAIKISENTLTKKLQCVSAFDTDEIDAIVDVLNITDNDEKVAIFLSSSSQNRDKVIHEQERKNDEESN